MHISLNVLLRQAIEKSLIVLGVKDLNFSIEYPPQPEFGQFSSNVAMVGAKKIGTSPKELAEKLISELANDQSINNYIDHWQVAGPGFVNAYVSDAWLKEVVGDIMSDNYQPEQIGQGKNIVLEYYQPNIAKLLHVGHVGTAILGDSMRRIFDVLGYHVISDTHMGDWGTQFGMLLYAYKQWGDRAHIEEDAIPRLVELYHKVNALAKEDPAIRESGKNEFVELEKKNPENIEIWQWMVKVSMVEFMKAYDLLNLKPHDVHLPESFYEDKMPAVVTELENKNLITVGETGEKYVDLEDQKLGRCIIIKSDGGTTYHLRDLATYVYRKQEFNFDRNIYFVDSRQSHHFEQLFAVLKKMGYPSDQNCVHVKIGLMSFAGNTLSTRSGDILKLSDMIKEVEEKARTVLQAKGRSEVQESTVKAVALASVKFFNYAHEVKSDIDFNWDKVLSFEGKTGVYMLYGLARLRSIVRKATEQKIVAEYLAPQTELEKQIGHLLGVTNDEIIRAADELSTHVLAEHAYKLMGLVSSWYDQSPIIKEQDLKLRSHRLAIVIACDKTIELLMGLMGIATVEEL